MTRKRAASADEGQSNIQDKNTQEREAESNNFMAAGRLDGSSLSECMRAHTRVCTPQ